MVAVVSAWFASVSPTAKALAALMAAVAVGLSLGGWLGLPAQVQVNVGDIAENSTEIHEIRESGDALKNNVNDIICILTQSDGANPLDCINP